MLGAMAGGREGELWRRRRQSATSWRNLRRAHAFDPSGSFRLEQSRREHGWWMDGWMGGWIKWIMPMDLARRPPGLDGGLWAGWGPGPPKRLDRRLRCHHPLG